jgi:uncharacterized protein (TIGR02266 family)
LSLGSPWIRVALHRSLAVVCVELDPALTPPRVISQLEAQTRKAGGRFLALKGIRQAKREDFARRFLTPSEGEHFTFDNFTAVADVVRGALQGAPESTSGIDPPTSPRLGSPLGQRGQPDDGARASTRYRVLLAVEFKTVDDFVREHATNISKGGLFVATPERPPLNSEARLTLHLPNGNRLHTVVRVVHHRDTSEPGGVGVAFSPDDVDFREELRAYLASLS